MSQWTEILHGSWRCLRAELQKSRRNAVWFIVTLGPVATASLTLLLLLNIGGPKNPPPVGQAAWTLAFAQGYGLFIMLLVPLFVAIVGAMVHGTDHANHTWKLLYTQPVPRASVFIGKTLMVLLLVMGAQVFFSGLLLGSGLLANVFRPVLQTGWDTAPVGLAFRLGAQVMLAALAITMIHHLLAMRFRSMGISIGIALVGLVSAVMLMQGWKYVKYYPYAFPALTFNPEGSGPFWTLQVWLGPVVALGLAVAGGWWLSRREAV